MHSSHCSSSLNLTFAPIQLTENRFEVGSDCWLQSSPSVSGPPKTRGSCCSLPELQPMLRIAPIAAPACSIGTELKEGKGPAKPAGTECSLGARWIFDQGPNQQEIVDQEVALDDTSAARAEQSPCTVYCSFKEENLTVLKRVTVGPECYSQSPSSWLPLQVLNQPTGCFPTENIT